jgi:hypothetical protein
MQHSDIHSHHFSLEFLGLSFIIVEMCISPCFEIEDDTDRNFKKPPYCNRL